MELEETCGVLYKDLVDQCQRRKGRCSAFPSKQGVEVLLAVCWLHPTRHQGMPWSLSWLLERRSADGGTKSEPWASAAGTHSQVWLALHGLPEQGCTITKDPKQPMTSGKSLKMDPGVHILNLLPQDSNTLTMRMSTCNVHTNMYKGDAATGCEIDR